MRSASRREILQSTAILGTLATLGIASDELLGPASAGQELKSSKRDPWRGLKFGVATYSLRGLKLDSAIAGIQRVGVSYASIKDIHLPLKSTTDERKAVAAKFREAGITLLSGGVVKMENDEGNCRNAFEYARDLGMPTIVCNPHPDSFPLLDKLVKEFDIKLAIHNHGPESDVFKSPLDVLQAAGRFDERIGLCVDVGHTARAGVDPAEAIRKGAKRLYDVHLKDTSEISRRNAEVEIGRGLLDIRSILQALLDVKFSHHVGIEHEKDARDPLPGLAESVGHTRGILTCL